MRAILFAAVVMAAAPAAALAQTPQAPPSRSANLQGPDVDKFMNNDYMRRFYALSVETLKGAAKPDVDAYEQKSYAISREFGVYMGVGPAHMQDHLKLVPRQVVQIAKEDPHVLDSFDNFKEAMVGPK